ncbi:MAG TPA: two-component regulator propeller domain-containing protein [Pyrinomonadaceae bacterium]|nr:two-component regulator propeller domain-containing protein [Pyrinomonadaceae bacterium]
MKNYSILFPSRILFVLLACAAVVSGEHLPIRSYTTADGLARDHIVRIKQDSRGFLWFCTSEGLSRYDGYHFVSYGTEQGLPNRIVNDLLETREGVYWIATNGGMAIFNPAIIVGQESATQSHFTAFPINQNERTLAVNKVIEGRSGAIWCATDKGLYRIIQANHDWQSEFIDFGMGPFGSGVIRDLKEDAEGALWVAADDGLYRRDSQGNIIRFATGDGLPSDVVRAVIQDGEGQFWAGTNKGLCRFVLAPDNVHLLVRRIYTTADGLLNDSIGCLLLTTGGQVWVGTGVGLNRWESGAAQGVSTFQGYTTQNGLLDNAITTLSEDRDGNVWLGTEAGGAAKIAHSGFTSYRMAEGLSSDRIGCILEDRDGNLRVAAANPDAFLNRFDGRHFASSNTRLPNGAAYSWGWYQTVFQDHDRDWWVATANGIYRYASDRKGDPAMSLPPKAVYRKKDGLTTDEVFRIFEDSRGDVWFGTLGDPVATLGRWERSSESFHRYSPKQDGVLSSAPTAFAEDRNGDVWIGFYSGGLVRYRAGSFRAFVDDNILSSGFIRGLYLDSKGRLWISTADGGLIRTDDPTGDNPQFVSFTTAQGLSSNQVTSVVEDKEGRLYIGTGRGLDQLDIETGHLKHYTTADGLSDSFVNVSYRDRSGALWFGTLRGLSRLIPQPDPHVSAPHIFISGLRAGNGPYQVADLGVADVVGLELAANDNRLEVDFVSIGLGPGEGIKYQYRLEGADQDWSPLTDHRSVNYAHLAPGRYKFLVRAVNSTGGLSPQPASISFRVLPPIWRRWWFVALALFFLGSALFALDRYRASRTRELRTALALSEKLTTELIGQRTELSLANRTLALEFEVTRILAEAATPGDAAPKILQTICESTGWEIGALWYVESRAEQLRCAELWHRPEAVAPEFEDLTRSSVFQPGVGLPGRVWESGKPIWITELASDRNFPRLAVAVGDGLKSAFGFPILLGSEVIGVSEFFSRQTRQREDELLGMLSVIGGQIGQLIERRRAEEALRESEDRFRTLAETASDPIITIDQASNIVFVNTATEKVFGYKLAEMVGNELTMLMPDYLRELHRAGFRRYFETGQKHVSWEAVELPGLHKSGRQIPLEVSFGEFNTNGKRYFTGIARDITERKRAAAALQRSREERLRELETVRQRIATDLHDDIGSSLTQISILSEVVQSSMAPDNTRAAKPLSLIANASRELIDAMSDIVWAINPQKDHLSDLTQRMRRFASDVFTARNVQFHFQVPAGDHDIPLGANIRREVFLVFKESVNNMIKHSRLTNAEIEFRVDDAQLALTMSDNGKGFDPSVESDGHGLMSMRERSQAIGGRIEFVSQQGRGTTIKLTVPREDHGRSEPLPPSPPT